MSTISVDLLLGEQIQAGRGVVALCSLSMLTAAEIKTSKSLSPFTFCHKRIFSLASSGQWSLNIHHHERYTCGRKSSFFSLE